MRRIEAAELGEELTAFRLQSPRKVCRLHERLLDLDRRFVVVVELEHDVGKALEVRIDRAVQGQLRVARVEATLLRIMVADLDIVEVARARVGQRSDVVE